MTDDRDLYADEARAAAAAVPVTPETVGRVVGVLRRQRRARHDERQAS